MRAIRLRSTKRYKRHRQRRAKSMSGEWKRWWPIRAITVVTGRDLLPVRVRLFPDYFLSLGAAFPLLTDRLRTVLAVKGSLRRAKCGRALDRSGPLWNAS